MKQHYHLRKHLKLKQSGITDKEYKQAIDCWKDTKCETIKDYMTLYLKTDV